MQSSSKTALIAGGWDKGKDPGEAFGSRLLPLSVSDRGFIDKEIPGHSGTGTGVHLITYTGVPIICHPPLHSFSTESNNSSASQIRYYV